MKDASHRVQSISLIWQVLKIDLEHFHNFCKVDFVVSHPFHKEREMDGARSFLTTSVKMFYMDAAEMAGSLPDGMSISRIPVFSALGRIIAWQSSRSGTMLNAYAALGV